MYAALTLFASIGILLLAFAGIAAVIEVQRNAARKATRRRHPSARRARLPMTTSELAAIITPATPRRRDA